MNILVLQGPNLNLLGSRDPAHYGDLTLSEICGHLDQLASELGCQLAHFQSNHEGALVDRVQQAARDGAAGALVNAGALTHTSVALRDALTFVALPFVEVHLSNIYAREPFRHRSLIADKAIGVVAGFHCHSYLMALRGLHAHLTR